MKNLSTFKNDCLTTINGVNYVQFDKVLSTYRIVKSPDLERYVFSFSNYLILVDIDNSYDLGHYQVYSVLSILFDDSNFVRFHSLFCSFKELIFSSYNVKCLGTCGFVFSSEFQRINQFRSYLHRCLNHLT